MLSMFNNGNIAYSSCEYCEYCSFCSDSEGCSGNYEWHRHIGGHGYNCGYYNYPNCHISYYYGLACEFQGFVYSYYINSDGACIV